MFRRGALGVLLCFGFVFSAKGAIKLELIASGFARPLWVTAPPGDSNRIFVLEEHVGRVRIVDLTSNAVKATPFLTVTNLLTGDEQGLLGLAFHPRYASNGYFYVNYVTKGGGANGHSEIARFEAKGDPKTAELADASSKKVLLTYDQPEVNHNGGWTAFGPDGYLYISTGDGGGAYDQHGGIGNGQSRNTLLGKILRIDVDHGDLYGIPSDNPFGAILSFRNEIWAFGLRNPWRCSFDRATGNLWVGDVGQDRREEVDVIPAGVGGLNFGWRPREGLIHTPAPVGANETPITPAIEPVYDYDHSTGSKCITGGYVYRGSRVPELQGKYIFGDYVSGRFWQLTPDASGTNGAVQEITAQLNPAPKQVTGLSSFGEDAAGELYVCDLADGQIFRIASTAIQLSVTRVASGNLDVNFNAATNQPYVLEASDALGIAGAPWTTWTNVPAGASRGVTVSAPVTAAQRYFRVRTD